MNNTVILVDTRSRDLKVYTASATSIPFSGEVILRKGIKIGSLEDLGDKEIQYQILVVLGGYQASSSGGFVKVLGEENFSQTSWVGGTGWGWEDRSGKRKGDGLRIFGPIPAILLPTGCRLERVKTPRNKNCSTAEAVLAGLEMKASACNSLMIAEGQSNYCNGFQIVVPQEYSCGGFDLEHRTDIFSPASLAKNFLGRYISDHKKFFCSLAISALKKAEVNSVGKLVEKIAGMKFPNGWQMIKEGAESLTEEYRQLGWAWEVEALPFESKVKVISPEKVEEVFSFDLKGDEKNYYSEFYSVDNFLAGENEAHKRARRAEMIQLCLDFFFSDDEWEEKQKKGFETAKSFSIGSLLELDEANEKTTYLVQPVFTGKNKDEVLSHSVGLTEGDGRLCLIALDENGKMLAHRIIGKDGNFGYYRLGGVVPVLPSEYKSKRDKAKEIVALLETFGKLSDYQIGNTRRDHYATMVVNNEGDKICSICCNGSDYVTPSLQYAATTEDLNDSVFHEPFYLNYSYCTKKEISEALLLKGKELGITIVSRGSF